MFVGGSFVEMYCGRSRIVGYEFAGQLTGFRCDRSDMDCSC